MPRVLVCTDPQPNPDGSCQQSAWIEQPSVADFLPDMQVAEMWGGVFFVGLVTLAAIAGILKPTRDPS